MIRRKEPIIPDAIVDQLLKHLAFNQPHILLL